MGEDQERSIDNRVCFLVKFQRHAYVSGSKEPDSSMEGVRCRRGGEDKEMLVDSHFWGNLWGDK